MDHSIGPLAQIPPGEGRNFDVAGLRIAVFHMRSGAVFAAQAECPHRNGPLADGLTDGSSVMCPLHDRTFDLATGAAIGGDCEITVYPARVDARGGIVVSVPS
jgi:nitrite reductase (NADH) small subunit